MSELMYTSKLHFLGNLQPRSTISVTEQQLVKVFIKFKTLIELYIHSTRPLLLTFYKKQIKI